MCDDFFDDFSWEDLAIALGLGEEIAKEERERFNLIQDEAEDLGEDDVAWYEEN